MKALVGAAGDQMSQAPALLELRALRVSLGQGAWQLGPVDLSVPAGAFTGLIGPNGSGKSTLLRLAAGVLPPDDGTVLLDGQGLASRDRRLVAQRLAYLPQQVSSDYDYLVTEVVAMGRFPHQAGLGFLGHHDLAVIQNCLAETDVSHLRERRLSTLSGGERQRVFLASVLAQEPALLLLDEPTSALDLHHQVEFFALLQRLAGRGMAILIVTHDLNLAALYCHTLVLLQQGRILRQGSPDTVLEAATLAQAYGPGILVTRHPRHDRPAILPMKDE